jgi:hypothetical protein
VLSKAGILNTSLGVGKRHRKLEVGGREGPHISYFVDQASVLRQESMQHSEFCRRGTWNPSFSLAPSCQVLALIHVSLKVCSALQLLATHLILILAYRI